MKDLYLAKYKAHRKSAEQRGLAFELTYQQWRDIWGDKIEQRGVRVGQYVMMRTRDEGGYTLGNVRIGLQRENSQEYGVACRVRRATRGASYFRQDSRLVSAGALDWLDGRRDVFAEYVEDEEEIA